ncbi:hypothetical protein BGX26_006808 [Mortierella sp. AD094]|nr:hypothetical protein BGX26_006808 [Mortierella sp. AD094]
MAYHNYNHNLANHNIANHNYDNEDHRAAYTASASVLGPIPTSSVTDPNSGFPKVAIIGVTVAGLIVVGFVTTVLIMKHNRRQRSHKALGQDDLFDHLPIEPPSPAPLMTVLNGQHNTHVQQHELEPMAHTKESRVETKEFKVETKGFKAHTKEYKAETKEYKAETKGSKAEVKGSKVEVKGSKGGSQGFHDPGSQGFTQSQPTTTPGGSGTMGQGPTPGSAVGGGGGGGGQGISNVNPLQHLGVGVGQLPPTPHGVPGNGLPPINLQTRPSGGSKARPDSSNQYSMLLPTSPTNSTFSGEGGLVDDTSIPAQGTVTIAPLPLDYRHSITSSNDSWDDRSQELGYSPRSKQALLNQSRYYDAASSQHSSGRVFPSPHVATIPVAHSPEVRSPQDVSQDNTIDSVVSTGNVSSLNTFDRRHPQSHEGAEGIGSLFAVSSSASSRNPQDRH